MGVAYAFVALYELYVPVMLRVGPRLIDFQSSADVKKLFSYLALAVDAGIVANIGFDGSLETIVGTANCPNRISGLRARTGSAAWGRSWCDSSCSVPAGRIETAERRLDSNTRCDVPPWMKGSD